jgi:hypothetical protein
VPVSICAEQAFERRIWKLAVGAFEAMHSPSSSLAMGVFKAMHSPSLIRVERRNLKGMQWKLAMGAFRPSLRWELSTQ